MPLKPFVLMCFMLLQFHAKAQPQTIINLNPDPKGEPWIANGYTPPDPKTEISLQEIQSIMRQNALHLKAATLVSKIDNSKQIYIRPPFNQAGGSCGSASRICYMFAYEINCLRGLNGALAENKYPSHFTWLLTDQNSGKEGMAIANGVPNSVVYGGDTYSSVLGGDVGWPGMDEAPAYGWMNGYDKWFQAMNNRIEKTVSFSLDTPEKLDALKLWFIDHWGDASFPAGGIVGSGCAITNAKIEKLTSGSNIGKSFVKEWGPQVDHGITLVGYDDDVEYDFNGDGKITNNIDTNYDGVVNMLDWEKGAVIFLNSWGSGWGNGGSVYVPYRLLKKNGMGAELYFARKNYRPIRTMKIKMNYSARSELKLSVGVAQDINAGVPEKIIGCQHFLYAGNGKVPMLGKWADGVMHAEDMEFGYDVTDLTEGLDAAKPLKYFLKIETKGDAAGNGKVTSMALLNYDDPSGQVETVSAGQNVAIANAGKVTYLSVVTPGGKPIPSKYISQKGWKLIYTDSEETKADGNAVNAFDGDNSTIWHTGWVDRNVPMPHEIQIDLGQMQKVTGFVYVPRQSGVNGNIADYEFYLSNDKNNWGTPFSVGKWTSISGEKEVKFNNPVEGQYIRLRALSEINGNAWASMAELKLIGSTTTDGALTGTTNLEIGNNITAFPNPTSDQVNVLMPSGSGFTYSIFSSAGLVLERGTVEPNTAIHSFNLQKYPAGLFLIKLVDQAEEVYLVKIIKQ